MAGREPCNCGCANVFSDREARNDLARYLREGSTGATKALIEAIKAAGIEGASLLDVGGGIGAIQLELLAAGASTAESVDATAAYIEVARAEAARRGYAERTSYRVGTLEQLAGAVNGADVVTLDKVVCCDPNLPALLAEVTRHARRMVGLIYPRVTWWNRFASRLLSVWGWITRDPTRWYLHPTEAVDGTLERAGFVRNDITRTLIWQVALYVRADERAGPAVTPGG